MDDLKRMTCEKMNIVVNFGNDGAFRFYAAAGEIQVDQIITIPVNADGGMDCCVMWVGDPFVDPNLGSMVEFRVVAVDDVPAFKKLLAEHAKTLH